MNFLRFGGRRFVMAMGAGITATALQCFGKLDAQGSSYMAIVLGTVAAYITGNAAENHSNVKFGGSTKDDK